MFQLDENRSRRAADLIRAAGHDAVTVVRLALWHDNFDQWREAPKIGFVERQQPALAMCQHRRDKIGVMNLTTSE